MNEGAPRFLADVMLGRLARWLRALGYDTRYDSSFDDGALAKLARAEERILLTRDVELTRRRGVRALLIQDDRVKPQLRQVVLACGLNANLAFTRCIQCNAQLEPLADAHAAGLVPPYVLQTQTRFRQCPQCAKVYWRGTHWARMSELLRELEAANEP